MGKKRKKEKMEAPGTMVLAIVFLSWFILVYFVQWAALRGNWFVN